MAVYNSSKSVKKPEVLKTPKGLGNVSSISTDGHSSFLITDTNSNAVFVLDEGGKFRLNVTEDLGLQDSVVTQSQLWLGYTDGRYCNRLRIME